MDTRKLSFNELPDAVAVISDKIGKIEEMVKSLQNPTTLPAPDTHYTLPEAAAYCRLAEPTFRVYLRKREVSGSKLGKSWLFTQADLDAFLARYRVKTGAELEAMSNQILRRTR